MGARYFEKSIEGRTVIYDREKDILQFSSDEQIPSPYSLPRLCLAAPYKTDILVTTNCNQHCRNCFTGCTPDKPGSDMPYPELIRRLEERKDSRIRILITGGEPFLHKEISRILHLPESFSTLCFAVCTNGGLIRDFHVAMLKACDWMTILSLHGDARTHDRYTDNDSHRKALQALDRLSAAKVRTKIYSVLHKDTTPEDVNHVLQVKQDYGVSYVKFMTPRPYGRYETGIPEGIIDYVNKLTSGDIGLQLTSSHTELIGIDGTSLLTD